MPPPTDGLPGATDPRLTEQDLQGTPGDSAAAAAAPTNPLGVRGSPGAVDEAGKLPEPPPGDRASKHDPCSAAKAAGGEPLVAPNLVFGTAAAASAAAGGGRAGDQSAADAAAAPAAALKKTPPPQALAAPLGTLRRVTWLISNDMMNQDWCIARLFPTGAPAVPAAEDPRSDELLTKVYRAPRQCPAWRECIRRTDRVLLGWQGHASAFRKLADVKNLRPQVILPLLEIASRDLDFRDLGDALRTAEALDEVNRGRLEGPPEYVLSCLDTLENTLGQNPIRSPSIGVEEKGHITNGLVDVLAWLGVEDAAQAKGLAVRHVDALISESGETTGGAGDVTAAVVTKHQATRKRKNPPASSAFAAFSTGDRVAATRNGATRQGSVAFQKGGWWTVNLDPVAQGGQEESKAFRAVELDVLPKAAL